MDVKFDEAFDRIFKQPISAESLQRAEKAARDTCCNQHGYRLKSQHGEVERIRKEGGA